MLAPIAAHNLSLPNWCLNGCTVQSQLLRLDELLKPAQVLRRQEGRLPGRIKTKSFLGECEPRGCELRNAKTLPRSRT